MSDVETMCCIKKCAALWGTSEEFDAFLSAVAREAQENSAWSYGTGTPDFEECAALSEGATGQSDVGAAINRIIAMHERNGCQFKNLEAPYLWYAAPKRGYEYRACLRVLLNGTEFIPWDGERCLAQDFGVDMRWRPFESVFVLGESGTDDVDYTAVFEAMDAVARFYPRDRYYSLLEIVSFNPSDAKPDWKSPTALGCFRDIRTGQESYLEIEYEGYSYHGDEDYLGLYLRDEAPQETKSFKRTVLDFFLPARGTQSTG